MSQGLSKEPENPTDNSANSNKAEDLRRMGIQEHAALVQAIMLNFPEIYEGQTGSDTVRQPDRHGNAERAIERPATAQSEPDFA